MDNFQVYCLRFSCEAVTTVQVPLFTGSMLRGAFFAALRHDFCLNKSASSCLACPLHSSCPICRLVATVDEACP